MARTGQATTPFSVLLSAARAAAAAALVSAISATLMTLPMAMGAAGIAESLLSVLLLGFMIASPGALIVSLIVVLAITTARRVLPALHARPLLFSAAFALLGAGLAALAAYIIGTVLFVPGRGNAGGVDLLAMLVFSAAIGGVVIGAMLARSGQRTSHS